MNAMKLTTKKSSVLLVACVLIASASAAKAAPVSIDFNTVAGFEQTGGVTGVNQSGEPTNADGLMLPGQVGPWNGLTVGNGDFADNFGAARTITVGAVTFTFNPGGAGTYRTFQSGTNDLRSDVVYMTGGTSGSLSWTLTGLEAGHVYDIILFGQDGPANPADFSIAGHNAGNGTGNPVTLDAENDGNFTNVVATGGTISGTFAFASGEAASAWSGIQFEDVTVPEPSTAVLALCGLVGCVATRRRRRRA